MNVFFVDKNGTSGVIQNDLSVEAEGPISEDVYRFLEDTECSHDETPVTVTTLTSGFLIELYIHTSVQKVEPVSTDSRK